MFATILQVAIGGAIGSVLRFLVILTVAFPFGTLAVNAAGSFLMGAAFVYLAQRGMDRWVFVVMVGMLGAFTTFSTFSLDTFRLFEAGRLGAAGLYVVGSVSISILALFLGVFAVKAFQV